MCIRLSFNTCSSLSTAVATRFEQMPLTSSLIGNGDQMEQQIAQRIAKRFNKQVFVSCNVPDSPELYVCIERKIYELLKQTDFIQ